jgi:glycosyltransferase involved in cell wall biosynthesis
MTKLITIVIATYNSELTLSKCLDSIIAQKCELVELIIVDGDSTDRTLEILKRYESNIDSLVSETDEGIYDAWNKGIELSNSEWIMFVGSDDQLLPNCIEIYKKKASFNSDIDYISGKIMIINKEGKHLREFGQPYSWKTFRSIMNLAHVSALHNHKIYSKYGLYDVDYKICGDYELLLRPGNQLKTIFINDILGKMTTGGVSYGSFSALKESKNAKLKHYTKFIVLIYVDYFLSIIRLALKKLLYKVRILKDL